jgi:hypothetical protein
MFFHKHINFTNAALSPHRQFLHVTFRVATHDSFRFVAAVYNLQNPGMFREMKSDAPIDAIFLENTSPECSQLIHITGSKFTLSQVSVAKDRLAMEEMKGAFGVRHLLHFQFHRPSNTLWIVTATSLHELSCSSEGVRLKSTEHIQIAPTSVLPSDLALEATSQLVLPFYRPTRYRFYVYRNDGIVCFVQQLFEGVDSSCAFYVSIYPNGYNRTIFVPGVGVDLPLCFLGYDAIVAVFVPNYFVCVVNLSKSPPLISVLPKGFAASVCGRCCANSPIENHIIDLDGADVFEVAFDFSASALLLPILTKTSWEVIAQICVGTGCPNHFGHFFQMIQMANDPTILTALVHQLFQYIVAPQISATHRISGETSSTATLLKVEPLPFAGHKKRIGYPPGTLEHLLELDEEFPSADGGSRRLVFRNLVDLFLCRRDSRTIDIAVKRAFQELHRQNEVVLILREAIDFWAHTFKPSPLDQLRLAISIQTETATENLPAIPCLREEIGLFVTQNCSDTLSRRLSRAKLGRLVLMNSTADNELDWWKDRLPNWNPSGMNEGSSSCSIRHWKSGSVDSRMVFSSALSATLAWGDEERSAIL